MSAPKDFNGYTEAERVAGRYSCEGCGETPRVGVPCGCPSEELTATCPSCGHTGPEGQDFSWLEEGFNGIQAGDLLLVLSDLRAAGAEWVAEAVGRHWKAGEHYYIDERVNVPKRLRKRFDAINDKLLAAADARFEQGREGGAK